MTIYDQSKKNITKTYYLIFLFFIFVIVFGWILSYIFDNSIILIIAAIIAIVQSFVSYFYSDKIALASVGAKKVERIEAPELHRLVENLAITAGLPKPKIYLIYDSSPNAFATGRNPKNSAIAVTTGLLEILNKNELQGVLAHEMSHIGNYDILTMSVVVVLVGLIAIASNLALRWSFLGAGSSENNKNGNAIIFLIGIIAIILAPIAAQIIQLSISRKREFLADADSVLLTRYPKGLADALEKISEYPYGLKNVNNATAHLFIANPLKRGKTNWLTKLFLTHPPVKERIKILRESQ
jgi:heat shock protein HtpX